jgi:methyltransferase family protein
MNHPDTPLTTAPTAPSGVGTGNSAEFSYQDKRLGDTEVIAVATAPDVFRPTSTTVLLLHAARKALAKHGVHSVLDLGCGTGIVAVVLAKLLPAGAVVCASDLSPPPWPSPGATPSGTGQRCNAALVVCSTPGAGSAST